MLFRKEYVEKLLRYKDMDVIKVITGIRRSGKSTIMKQLQDYYSSLGIASDHMY